MIDTALNIVLDIFDQLYPQLRLQSCDEQV